MKELNSDFYSFGRVWLIAIIILLPKVDAIAQWQFLDNPFTVHQGTPSNGGAWCFASEKEEIFSAGYKGILRSTDIGKTWHFLDSSFKTVHVRFLLVKDHVIHNGWDRGLYRSIDEGKSWEKIDSTDISTVYLLSNFDSTIFISCDYYLRSSMSFETLLLRSTDNGVSWAEVENGLELIGRFTAMVRLNQQYFMSSFGAGLYGLDMDSSIFTSPDGISWHRLISNSVGRVGCLAGKAHFLFAGSSQGVFRSSDTLLHWDRVFEIADTSWITNITFIDSSVFIVDKCRGIFQSDDFGEHWHDVNNGISGNVNTLYLYGDYLFGGTTTGIWRRPLSEFTSMVEEPAQKINTQFHLLSNPIISTADFEFELLTEPATLEIFDELGRLIQKAILPRGLSRFSVNIESAPRGIYFARMGSLEVKFIRE
ncbi:MAG: hypothetical protein WCH46_06515 [bacterium]